MGGQLFQIFWIISIFSEHRKVMHLSNTDIQDMVWSIDNNAAVRWNFVSLMAAIPDT